MEPLIVLLFFGLLIWAYYSNKSRKEKKILHAQRVAEIAAIAEQAEELFNSISKAKTAQTKVNKCEKAVNMLLSIEGYPESRDIIKNYDETLIRMTCVKTVLPIIDLIEKSYRNKFKGKDKAELNNLQDAIYEIRKREITNEMFEKALVFPEGTGEIVTTEGIESRCKELGWKPD